MNASTTVYVNEFVQLLRTILIAACTPRHWDILRDLYKHLTAQ